MRYSRDISLLYLLLLALAVLYMALRITTLQKAWNVYSICSLYSSVQVIEIPPILKGLCMVGGRRLDYNNKGRQHSLLSPLVNVLRQLSADEHETKKAPL